MYFLKACVFHCFVERTCVGYSKLYLPKEYFTALTHLNSYFFSSFALHNIDVPKDGAFFVCFLLFPYT